MVVNDPCGIACLIVTYLAIFYADYVVIRWIVLQTMPNSLWGPIHVIAFNSIIFLLGMAHWKAVLLDPGTVPLPQNRVDFSDMQFNGHSNTSDDWTVCMRCETYRPPRAHHCRICKRCIRRMDHHCPWINNCVGERNQKYFMQFLVYVGILSIYSTILIVGSWLHECKECSTEMSFKQAKMMHTILLLLESILFGLFVCAILVDQVQAILTDETAIEAKQQKGGWRYHKSKLALLSEVCGRGHPILWLLPCQTTHRKQGEPLLTHDV